MVSVSNIAREIGVSYSTMIAKDSRYGHIPRVKVDGEYYYSDDAAHEARNIQEAHYWFKQEVSQFLDYLIAKLGKDKVKKRLKFNGHIAHFRKHGSLSPKRAIQVFVRFRNYIREYDRIKERAYNGDEEALKYFGEV